MNSYYTDNKNQQVLLALMKAHGIRKIIASPGGTNPAMVISFQHDDYFELYSCVDERSAAYMACGLAEESGEPVALCCTGATASRNYMSALTEAYYRKIPVLAITCSRPNYNLGHLMPQVTNRNVHPADVMNEGEHLQVIKDKYDFWDVETKVNKALLTLSRRGGGPVHVNVEVTTQSCTTKELPPVNVIRRITSGGNFPQIEYHSIGIFIGSHKRFSNEETELLEHFCESYNAVILKDHTSGYYGKYAVHYALLGTQKHKYGFSHFDLLIHLGEISGDYLTFEHIDAEHIWRVSEDGEARIRFGRLDYIFEMEVSTFLIEYTKNKMLVKTPLFNVINNEYEELYSRIPELPLSHIYIAHKLAPLMPSNSVIHFAILNALRSWNFFKLDPTIRTNCNVGGFGIDGCTSTLIGASLANPNKLYFLITGDLAFFYDLNSLGNRHIGKNIRILLLNDGKGAEFCHYMFPKYEEDTSLFVAGAGHFGNQSQNLVKHFSEDLGFDYLHANSAEEFILNYKQFVDPRMSEKPILFEVITTTDNQSDAWKLLSFIKDETTSKKISHVLKAGVKRIKDKISK